MHMNTICMNLHNIYLAVTSSRAELLNKSTFFHMRVTESDLDTKVRKMFITF